jgi:hypothetical protein
MTKNDSAIVTVAFGHSTEHLDYTFTSFGINQGVPLHAFVLGEKLPERRFPEIEYHLIKPVPDFSHPLREVYFRRMELIDQLDVKYALVVDSYDVLCLQILPPFEKILAGFDMAACVEHPGSRYILGQGFTTNFINGGVFFWNVSASRDVRAEIVARGRSHFRIVADDQLCINEVIQTKYYDRLRVLPSQYDYRAFLKRKQRGWPTVEHLDGVLIYHNGWCIEEARKLRPSIRTKAGLPALPTDGHSLSKMQQWKRSLVERTVSHIVNESLPFRTWMELTRLFGTILKLLRII